MGASTIFRLKLSSHFTILFQTVCIGDSIRTVSYATYTEMHQIYVKCKFTTNKNGITTFVLLIWATTVSPNFVILDSSTGTH